MKTRGSKKLLKEIEGFLKDTPMYIDTAFVHDVEIVLEKFLPKELMRKCVHPSVCIPLWDLAVCRLYRRNLEDPSRKANPSYLDNSVATLKMLRAYIKRNTVNGWIDWEALLEHVKGESQ